MNVMGRWLAIDYGSKRTGLAVTDPLKLIANGLATVPTHQLLSYLQEYLRKEKVEKFVVGKPMTLRNQPSDNMKNVEQGVKMLRKHFPLIPIEMVDERFTSSIAHRAMIDGGLKKKDRQNKALVDEISAVIILQSYMESNRL